jgi:hypothetical protein
MDEEEIFRYRARALLVELDTAAGPTCLPEWNIRAQALLAFEAIRRLQSSPPASRSTAAASSAWPGLT